VKFSQELTDDSPYRGRESIAGKDSLTLARDIMAIDQEQFSAASRKSPMQRAKLRGLRRNAEVAVANTRATGVPASDT
jgi:epoxyqueuosine reductase QueG